MERSRPWYLLITLVVVVLGLGSRGFRGELPGFLGEYAGDTLWATMVFLLIALVWNRALTWKIGLAAGLFCLGIEVSQLYHAAWIDALRGNRLGALVLGHGFLWSDLVCYAAGVAMAWGGEVVVAISRSERSF